MEEGGATRGKTLTLHTRAAHAHTHTQTATLVFIRKEELHYSRHSPRTPNWKCCVCTHTVLCYSQSAAQTATLVFMGMRATLLKTHTPHMQLSLHTQLEVLCYSQSAAQTTTLVFIGKSYTTQDTHSAHAALRAEPAALQPGTAWVCMQCFKFCTLIVCVHTQQFVLHTYNQHADLKCCARLQSAAGSALRAAHTAAALSAARTHSHTHRAPPHLVNHLVLLHRPLLLEVLRLDVNFVHGTAAA